MCGFIAQLVEHRTGIAEVTGSNPVEALISFRLLLSNCLNWKIHCDDHSSLSFTTAVQIWIISYKLHIIIIIIIIIIIMIMIMIMIMIIIIITNIMIIIIIIELTAK